MFKVRRFMGVAAFAALSLSAVACTDNGTTNNFPDMAGQTGHDMASTMNDMPSSPPDMVCACNSNPMDNVGFLNSCAPPSVDFVDIVPHYPANAPNGMLPQLP